MDPTSTVTPRSQRGTGNDTAANQCLENEAVQLHEREKLAKNLNVNRSYVIVGNIKEYSFLTSFTTGGGGGGSGGGGCAPS